MMVQQSGESLGGWCVNHPCTYPLGCSLPTSTGVVWPDSTEVRGTSSQLRPIRELGVLRLPWPFQQNLLKIHAFKVQREEDSDPGNHEIFFRFRLRLSVFRGQTFVDGPLVHLSLNRLSSVLLSPKRGEEHTHFVRSTVSHMFLPSQPTPN